MFFRPLCRKSRRNRFHDLTAPAPRLRHRKIIPRYDIEESDLHRKLADKYGLAPQSLSDIRTFLDDERHERFNRLIDARFPDHVLLELLSDFETRNDINIRRLVTDNADVPTISNTSSVSSGTR